jgi:hypothetical protein
MFCSAGFPGLPNDELGSIFRHFRGLVRRLRMVPPGAPCYLQTVVEATQD